MKHIHFDVDKAGFYGAYWENKIPSKYTIIAMLGDDPEDHMAKSAVKWLLKKGINVLTMSPGKKNYSHHNYPIERIENAIKWLLAHNTEKIGIVGDSTTGTLALTAASYFPEISLTIAMTPSDFIWQGFEQGKKDGYTEWPIEGESLFTYCGKPLPYMPFCYQHPIYGQVMKEEAKRTKNMLCSRKVFDDSENAHPITEDEFIKVENIKGKLLLIGADDDVLWDTSKYIHRMEKRLNEKKHDCTVEVYTYEHGTHFVFPQSLMKMMLPIGHNLFVKLAFADAKKFSKEYLATRVDIDLRVRNTINKWVE